MTDIPGHNGSSSDGDYRPMSEKAQSYRNSWLRFVVLGVLLTILVVLGYMLYQKRMNAKVDAPHVEEEYKPGLAVAGKSKGDDVQGAFITNEGAKTKLAGTWESSEAGETRSVTYTPDGTFIYTLEKAGMPKQVLQGRWSLVRVERPSTDTPVKVISLQTEWTLDSVPPFEGIISLDKPDTIGHPRIEMKADANKEKVTLTRKK